MHKAYKSSLAIRDLMIYHITLEYTNKVQINNNNNISLLYIMHIFHLYYKWARKLLDNCGKIYGAH